MPTKRASGGGEESVGSQKWIIKAIAILAALALGWAVTAQLRRIDKLETAVEAHEKAISDGKSRADRLSDKLDTHPHPQDPAIADLKRRMDRIEYPRPWESRTAAPRR